VGGQIEITAHVGELIKRKRGARQHRATSQLTQAIPAMADFLARATAKGHYLASITRFMGQMLNHYGAQAMKEAVAETLRRDVPHNNAVRLALERARQSIQELMTLSFMADASNVMLVGPNGVGKSILACNLGQSAIPTNLGDADVPF
jgi:hypothetical protein